jgi:hypothetical protein
MKRLVTKIGAVSSGAGVAVQIVGPSPNRTYLELGLTTAVITAFKNSAPTGDTDGFSFTSNLGTNRLIFERSKHGDIVGQPFYGRCGSAQVYSYIETLEEDT